MNFIIQFDRHMKLYVVALNRSQLHIVSNGPLKVIMRFTQIEIFWKEVSDSEYHLFR